MSTKEKQVFLRQQFALQQKYFNKTYPAASRNIICFDGRAIGRLYTDFNSVSKQLHLFDITLQREWRNRGIGSYFIQQLKQQATKLEADITLYVHMTNPAHHYYLKHGFACVRSEQQHYLMQWQQPQ
ncbi:GNAT family N-acetyltransferase [Saccharobesus litoralis]|nr:GNAT family N-acetyltransferase [Saccharobesus litoralis]